MNQKSYKERGFFAHYRNSSTRATFIKEANGRKPDVVDA